MAQDGRRDWHALAQDYIDFEAVDVDGQGGRMTAVAGILDQILIREGWPAYTDHPQDRGGPTKGGITLATLTAARGHHTTIADLQALTKTEALRIYQDRYVDTHGIHKIPDDRLLGMVVDDAVLSGPGVAVQDLQQAVGATVDGVIGVQTLGAIQQLGYRETLAETVIVRAMRMVRIVQKDPGQLVFLGGWMSRVLHFLGAGK